MWTKIKKHNMLRKVQRSGFKGSGLWVQGFKGSEFKVQRFRVWCFALRATTPHAGFKGSGLRVLGSEIQGSRVLDSDFVPLSFDIASDLYLQLSNL